MKRLTPGWKRLALQAGVLAGIALVVGRPPAPADAAPLCIAEGQCTYDKPLFLFVVDYSTDMNAGFDPEHTRWEAAVDLLVGLVDAQNGYVQGSAILGLMRFGHDPNAMQPGSAIPGDTTDLVDGQRLDVPFYDPDDPAKQYLECNGEAFKAALAALPPPLQGAPDGIGAWTRGALARAQAYLAQTAADHPDDMGQRRAALVVLTQGVWTDASGQTALGPPEQDPAPLAAELLAQAPPVPTFVISFGGAQGTLAADALAAAGGTGEALPGADPDALVLPLAEVIEDIKQDVEQPVCTPRMPRIMVLLDASSSMLNVAGDSMHGLMGETPWDRVRAALHDSLLHSTVVNQNMYLEDMSFAGLAVFGEPALVVDYGYCHAENIQWALDPASSCQAPDCLDPWAGPPIAWTFQDGAQIDPPGFEDATSSHMPRCDLDPQEPDACTGSGAAVHLGLELVRDAQAAYKAACLQDDAPYPCSPQTKFVNLLITDGPHDSPDAAVQAALVEMQTAGVTTYVVGFGELIASPQAQQDLASMAAWGSGGALLHFDAADPPALAAALGAIVADIYADITFDPCCAFFGCGSLDESDGDGEPDPVPDETTADATSTSTTDATSTSTTSTTSTGTTSTTSSTTDDPTTKGDVPTSDGVATSEPQTTEESATETAGLVMTDGCACASGRDRGPARAVLVALTVLGLVRRPRDRESRRLRV